MIQPGVLSDQIERRKTPEAPPPTRLDSLNLLLLGLRRASAT